MTKLIAETERLRLFELSDSSVSDVEFMLSQLNDPGFIAHIRDEGVRDLAQAAQFLRDRPMRSYAEHGHGLYRVEDKVTGASVGSAGLIRREGLDAPDLGYAFLSQYHGRGYAVEAGQAVLDFSRDSLRLDRVLAVVSPDNRASIRVLQKLRFDYAKMVKLSHNDSELKLFELNLRADGAGS